MVYVLADTYEFIDSKQYPLSSCLTCGLERLSLFQFFESWFGFSRCIVTAPPDSSVAVLSIKRRVVPPQEQAFWPPGGSLSGEVVTTLQPVLWMLHAQSRSSQPPDSFWAPHPKRAQAHTDCGPESPLGPTVEGHPCSLSCSVCFEERCSQFIFSCPKLRMAPSPIPSADGLLYLNVLLESSQTARIIWSRVPSLSDISEFPPASAHPRWEKAPFVTFSRKEKWKGENQGFS